MVFNSDADSQSIVDEVLKITKSTVGKYPLKDIARRVNFALDRYFELAENAAGKGTFDDINQSSPPILTQNLVSGTNKYKVSSFAGTYSGSILNFVRLEVLDSSGNSHTLIPEAIEELQESFPTLYSTTASGVPTYYLKIGDFIYLRSSPNYNSTNGLVAYAERAASYFASTDTTKVAGIPVIHHMFLCRFAAQPFLEEWTMSNAQSNKQNIFEDEDKIVRYWSRVNKNNRMKANVECNK